MLRKSVPGKVGTKVPLDPFTMCLWLTVVAVVWAGCGMLLKTKPEGPGDVIRVARELGGAWYAGFWSDGILAFALKMCLIIVTGSALARIPLISRTTRAACHWIAGKWPRAVPAIVSFVAMSTGMISWGFSLVLSSIIVREFAFVAAHEKHSAIQRRYGLIVAASYMGLLVWHGGLSGSAPLAANSLPSEDRYHVSIMDSVFDLRNGIVTGVIAALVILYFIVRSLPDEPKRNLEVPKGIVDEAEKAHAEAENAEREAAKAGKSPSRRSGKRPLTGQIKEQPPRDAWWAIFALLFVSLVAVLGMVEVVDSTVETKEEAASLLSYLQAVDLNLVICVFLVLGIAMFLWSPRGYQSAAQASANSILPIALQFPFYGGIRGVLGLKWSEEGTGLAGLLSERLRVTDSTFSGLGPLADVLDAEKAHLVSTYLSAAALNIFVPSGGGQWVIQNPIVWGAAPSGTSAEYAGQLLMAFAYGDQVSNLIQPFWLLPIVALTGVDIRGVLRITIEIFAIVFFAFLALIVLL